MLVHQLVKCLKEGWVLAVLKTDVLLLKALILRH